MTTANAARAGSKDVTHLRLEALGFRGFRVWGLECRLQGLGFGV